MSSNEAFRTFVVSPALKTVAGGFLVTALLIILAILSFSFTIPFIYWSSQKDKLRVIVKRMIFHEY
jgi:hypothetical protein